MQSMFFPEGIILPNIFTLKFNEWNSNRSTLKHRKIKLIKAMRKCMFSFVTGKIAVPDCVTLEIARENLDLRTDKDLKK